MQKLLKMSHGKWGRLSSGEQDKVRQTEQNRENVNKRMTYTNKKEQTDGALRETARESINTKDISVQGVECSQLLSRQASQ